MSNKTNDEKLRILQERLAQIKQKQDTPVPARQQREIVIKIATPKNENLKRERTPLNLLWVRNIAILCVFVYGAFYAYNNINLNSLSPNFSLEKVTEEVVPTQLEYKFKLDGNNIAIVSTQNLITDEDSAKIMANDLKAKGFKSDYIYLPEYSNFTGKVYQVFIGPYENKEETKQWAKNLESEFNIITL